MFVNKRLRILMLDLHIMYLESNAELGTRKKNTKASEIIKNY